MVWLVRAVVLFWRDMDAGFGGLVASGRCSKEEDICNAGFEVVDSDRSCRRAAGMEKPDPERREMSLAGSWVDAPAEVEEVLDTTDAFCAALRRVNSRVRRFTCLRLAS